MIGRRLVLVGLAAALAATTATAAERPTQEQVQALTLKAAALLAANGVEKAREAFHREGEFRFGEIYVNVIDGNGTWLIYPPNPRNEGKSVLNAKDSGGKLLVQEIISVARDKGEGWVEYQWLNPASNRIEPKITYVKAVPGKDLITYIGLYK
ncbi:putative Methyl-accepting chemotaxis protein [Magnetospirillum sp. XM-1]|uniref:cache domain-containing protein n=1 Tax=Magnetospirillum sp. XM-1 TaxID=1663591 RepID=UPI00073DE77B|nr:cache domain-containing protein [Magnetospirillum sp. XM-1]CUW39799.1 putative Methyl-accepting chemotaxis protein [Magnetospirillum sp. XM-1]